MHFEDRGFKRQKQESILKKVNFTTFVFHRAPMTDNWQINILLFLVYQ